MTPVNLDFEYSEIREVDFDAIAIQATKDAKANAQATIKDLTIYPPKFHALIFADIQKRYTNATRVMAQFKKASIRSGIDESTAYDIKYWSEYVGALGQYVDYYNELSERLNPKRNKRGKSKEDIFKSFFADTKAFEIALAAISAYIVDKDGKGLRIPYGLHLGAAINVFKELNMFSSGFKQQPFINAFANYYCIKATNSNIVTGSTGNVSTEQRETLERVQNHMRKYLSNPATAKSKKGNA